MWKQWVNEIGEQSVNPTVPFWVHFFFFIPAHPGCVHQGATRTELLAAGMTAEWQDSSLQKNYFYHSRLGFNLFLCIE